MSSILIGILIVGFALFLAWLWPAERNVHRDAFGHWIESLMRFYEDGSTLVIVDRRRQAELRCVRLDSRRDGCGLMLSVRRTPLAEVYSELLRAACDSEGDLAIPIETDSDTLAAASFDVTNIWATGAGARCGRVAQKLFDLMAISTDSRFDLSFKGVRSLERTVEARQRQKQRRRQT